MKLKLKTSFVSPLSMEKFTGSNWLPFFCLRSIYKSPLIGKYTDTSIHLKSLSPSSILYQKFRDNLISKDEYFQEFREELEGIDFKEILGKIEYAVNICEAEGAVLLSYGSDINLSHRSVLSDIINDLGILEFPVEEFIL